jgi:ATP-dependent helicase/nuclease subunit B
MYDWLADTFDDNASTLVTANLRLSRTLLAAYGEERVAAGELAWKTPEIYVWRHWLHLMFDSADDFQGLPSRLNSQQSRLLWERCIQQEVDRSIVSISNLGRVARDAWSRMNEWELDREHCANAANGQDQRIFARSVRRYIAELETNSWVDDAALPTLICKLLGAGKIVPPRKLTLAGFDRVTPQVQAVLDAVTATGTELDVRESVSIGQSYFYGFDNPDAELRAAGTWAARELEDDPSLRVAIVVSGLERSAAKTAHLLREGLAPGWQYGSPKRAAAVNVSYGRKLSDYPAVHAALQMLRWTLDEQTGAEISLLIRSPFIGIGPAHGRSRLELLLRDWPDRQWNPGRLRQALRGRDKTEDSEDWLQRLGNLAELANGLPPTSRPSHWAQIIDEILNIVNWPGGSSLNSADFQLVNRWRDLLNEFGQLEMVEPRMSFASAVSRLSSMAGETLYQAEVEGAVLSVLGPLEAAGMEFDRLWVAGLSADEWPPQGRPSPLLSREIQADHDMPDSSPQDTARFARRVLRRLRGSAKVCHLSYASTVDDNGVLPTALLTDFEQAAVPADPGWHAEQMLGLSTLQHFPDPAPKLRDNEMIRGGAATINRQLSEPFSAFAFGRLGVRWLQAFTAGIAANVRGSLVHDALFNLYAERPSHSIICNWDEAELQTRIDAAVEQTFQRHERYADGVLRQLFRLERIRTAFLLNAVVGMDRNRNAFTVGTVERSIDGNIGPLSVSLRADRIDELENSDIVILDYKTGATKKFLTSGEPNDMQLVVYACITDRQVAGLGLFNVDSKHVGIDGAGPAIREIDDWQAALGRWKDQVHKAACAIADGDVRVNIRQASKDARPLALLSRFSELKRDS